MVRRMGDLDNIEKEIKEHLRENYISRKTLESWLVVALFVFAFELFFVLWWVLPQNNEIKEIRMMAAEEKRKNPKSVANGLDSIERGLLGLGREIEKISFRLNQEIFNRGEITGYKSEVEALRGKISSLERDISIIARQNNVSLSPPPIRQRRGRER